jgi:hypothetical protein
MSTVTAIAAIMGELEGIGKNQRNAQQGYDFRGIEDITPVLQKLLAKHGVVITPRYGKPEYASVTSSKGTAMVQCKIRGKYKVSDGTDHLKVVTWGEALDTGDKATNKAMTAAYKYCLIQLFTIGGPQNDADKDSPERGMQEGPTQKLVKIFREHGVKDMSEMATAVRAGLNDLMLDPDAKLSSLPPEDAELVVRQVILNQGWS